LFGYILLVEYKPGKLNGAVDALSRREEYGAAVLSISKPTFTLFNKLHTEVQNDPKVATVHAQLEDGMASMDWSLPDGLLLFHGKIFIPDSSELWSELLSHAHSGQEGV
jgi:hypothetical protein